MTSRIANRSKKRAAQEREYAKIAKEFLEENPYCEVHHGYKSVNGWEVFIECKATTIHHKKGRIGALLTDKRYFLGVCLTGHQWIEEHPIESKKEGYSLSRLSKTT